jgi:hypothetical protein
MPVLSVSRLAAAMSGLAVCLYLLPPFIAHILTHTGIAQSRWATFDRGRESNQGGIADNPDRARGPIAIWHNGDMAL